MDHHLRLTRTTATAKDRPVEALTRSRRIRLLVNRSVANRPGHGGPLCGFCFSLLASFSFFTKLRRESNANRQAVAKTFSLSPSLSLSLSRSLSLARALSVCLAVFPSSFSSRRALFVLNDRQKPPLKSNSSRRQHTDAHMRPCYLTIDLVG